MSPCRGRGAPHDGSDLLKGQGEYVVQHEREALSGSQRFEYHEQRTPVLLESLRQPFVFVHRSHFLDAFRHSSDERNLTDVTRRS
jgi:hypothetical protein